MRRLPEFALFLCGLVWSAAQAAERYPDRAITILCGFAAGAAADAQLRALAKAVSRDIGQTVIVENRPGAAGTFAAAALASAQPDGYTVAQVTNAVVRQPFIARTSYHPISDFTYVIGVSSFEFGLVVQAGSPWRTLDDLTAYARANPGKVSYGTIGIGTVPHQVMHKIGARSGIEWNHVPYRGSAMVLNDLLGGSIQAGSDTASWAPFVEAGKLRLLAVYGKQRLTRFPHVPTLQELGLEIADDAPWGIAAPRGVPPGRIKRLHDAFRKAMEDEGFRQSLELLASEPRYLSTADYQHYMASRVPIEREAVEQFGLRSE